MADILDGILAKVEKKYGSGVLNGRARDTFSGEARPTPISTGSLRLDWAIGGGEEFGGIYRRRITTVYGSKSTGKTTLANSVIANAQRQGCKAILVELEEKYDKVYAEACGVDLDELIFLHTISDDDKIQVITGEEVLTILLQVVMSKAVDLVVIDSISGLSPKLELNGEIGESFPALQARLVTKFIRKIPPYLARNNVALLINNQVRSNFGGTSFEAHYTMPGAYGLKHGTAVLIKAAHAYVNKQYRLKSGDEFVGSRARFFVEENQIANPYQSADVPIISGSGFDTAMEILSFAGEVDFISKKGSWYYYFDEHGEEVMLAQGETAAAEVLRESPALLESLKGRVVERMSAK